jgi:uncharacterized protein (DUF433 family)
MTDGGDQGGESEGAPGGGTGVGAAGEDWRPGSFCDSLLSMSSVVSQDPEVLGGEPVFAGTRVPVKSLFDHLEGGDSIEDFLKGFPSVRREQVIALLEEARAHALAAR